jgi:putative mycofactocin binding protein MftB
VTSIAAEGWRLSDSVSLQPEPFGALAYDFATRRLSFLKTPVLVTVVQGLAASPTVADALATAGVPETERAAYLDALSGLAATSILTRKDGA